MLSTLYIVATPIGNLEDMTLRALRILKEVDLILCEDTRVTMKLLGHYQINKPTLSYHQHSKMTKVDLIIDRLEKGESLAMVTDAGTPGISDPGGKLISQIIDVLGDKIKIISIPGPSALIAALSIAGVKADNFVFLGFPPHKKGREKFFAQIAEIKETAVFYESSHRILKSLNQLKNYLPEAKIVVCRELTKMFESVYRGKAEEIIKILESDKNNLKVEFAIIVGK